MTHEPSWREVARVLDERMEIAADQDTGRITVQIKSAAETRIRFLLDTPAAVRAVSCEPLLGPIGLTRLALGGGRYLDALGGDVASERGEIYAAAPSSLDWVIVGGESGRRADARPMHPLWARALRDQTVRARRAFFFKQWGSWAPAPWSVRVPDEVLDDPIRLAAAKVESERVGATLGYPVWADQFGWKGYEPAHKPWSMERTFLDETQQAAMRFYPGKSAGHELDGRSWHQWPTADGRIVEAGQRQPVAAAAG